MIAVIGLIMFAVSSYLALSKKMHLMVPFVVVPVIAGLFCGFSLPEVLNFAAEGVTGTFNSVLLCIFAVLYFSELSETGMFDIMVNRLVGITRGNIYIVMVVSVLVAFIGHLDGAYNTTYLIAIPALAAFLFNCFQSFLLLPIHIVIAMLSRSCRYSIGIY